jgi:hypothetical protein
MIFGWFRSKHLRSIDNTEIARIRTTYGDDAKRIIRDRLKSPTLSARDRNHWKRITRKL